MGFVVTGGSRMTGSASVWEKLLVRVLETRGTGGPGTEGGTIMSGSKKYIHLMVGQHWEIRGVSAHVEGTHRWMLWSPVCAFQS